MTVYRMIAVYILVLFSSIVQANEQLVSDHGREIILKDDGSWEYKSNDRYAVSADGRRVRLKADGRWEYTGKKTSAKAHVSGHAVVSDQLFVDETSVAIALSDFVIESVTTQAHKNTRKKTNSVFYISISAEKYAKTALALNFSNTDFSVKDSDGRQYSVQAVDPVTVTIQPGKKVIITVSVDGSPHWWTTKTMSVTIDKKAFSVANDIVLTTILSEAKKIAVKAVN